MFRHWRVLLVHQKFSSVVLMCVLYFVFVFMFTFTSLLSLSFHQLKYIFYIIITVVDTVSAAQRRNCVLSAICNGWNGTATAELRVGLGKLNCFVFIAHQLVPWLSAITADGCLVLLQLHSTEKALFCRWINSQHKLSSFTLSRSLSLSLLEMLMFIITCSFVYVPHSIPLPNERTNIFRFECQRKRRNTIRASNPYFFCRKQNTLHLLEYYY